MRVYMVNTDPMAAIAAKLNLGECAISIVYNNISI